MRRVNISFSAKICKDIKIKEDLMFVKFNFKKLLYCYKEKARVRMYVCGSARGGNDTSAISSEMRDSDPATLVSSPISM